MYGIYYSIATYDIIAWGSASIIYLKGLESMHKKVVKVLKFDETKSEIPLVIRQKYVLDSLVYHYDDLTHKYGSSNNITRQKSLELPASLQGVGKRNHNYKATFYFNLLKNEHEVFESKSLTKILKNVVKSLGNFKIF